VPDSGGDDEVSEVRGVLVFCVGLLLGGSFGAIMMGLVIADREEKR